MITYEPYNDDYLLILIGSRVIDGESDSLQYSIYYKDGNYRIDKFDGEYLSNISIFESQAYTTFIRMYMYTDTAETLNGNLLPIKVLDPGEYAKFKLNESFDANIETIYGEETICISMTKDDLDTKTWYSTNHFMPIKYEAYPKGSDEIITEYSIYEFRDDEDILDRMMNVDLID